MSAMATEMSEHVMVRLTPELRAQLQAAAERQERTVSQTVRLALKRFLEEAQPTR
jgi:predicted HicB family RNase H-like nuclease